MALLCPRCQKDDLVQKVSAVVEQGSAMHYHPSVTGLNHGYSQSGLAIKLARPPKPVHERSAWGFFSVVTVIAATLAILVFGIGLTLEAALGYLGNPAFWSPRNLSLTVPAVAAILVIVLIAKKREENGLRRSRFASDMQRWQAAIDEWNRSYYCTRDDLVFIPQA